MEERVNKTKIKRAEVLPNPEQLAPITHKPPVLTELRVAHLHHPSPMPALVDPQATEPGRAKATTRGRRAGRRHCESLLGYLSPWYSLQLAWKDRRGDGLVQEKQSITTLHFSFSKLSLTFSVNSNYPLLAAGDV